MLLLVQVLQAKGATSSPLVISSKEGAIPPPTQIIVAPNGWDAFSPQKAPPWWVWTSPQITTDEVDRGLRQLELIDGPARINERLTAAEPARQLVFEPQVAVSPGAAVAVSPAELSPQLQQVQRWEEEWMPPQQWACAGTPSPMESASGHRLIWR